MTSSKASLGTRHSWLTFALLAVAMIVTVQACGTTTHVVGDPAREPCTDEGFVEECYSVHHEGSQGRGSCRAGTRTCADGAWSECLGRVTPRVEDCATEEDDDCDGVTNEGCPCDEGATLDCYWGPPSTRNVGSCHDGRQECVDGLWSDRCRGEISPRSEHCTDETKGETPADENCNGIVDDACDCMQGQVGACYGAPPSTRNVGQCQDGEVVCGADGKVPVVCDNQMAPSAERCDGLDNDCNGTADDGAGLANQPVLPDPTPADCKRVMCVGDGTYADEPDAQDVADDGNVCTDDVCGPNGPESVNSSNSKPCGNGEQCQNGVCGACTAPADCGASGACYDWTCSSGSCVVVNNPAGFPVSGGTPPCMRRECDGVGGIVSVVDDSNVGSDGQQCTSDSCTNGTATYAPRSAGSGCTQGGGRVCDGAGICVECNAVADCPPPPDCAVSTSCTQKQCDSVVPNPVEGVACTMPNTGDPGLCDVNAACQSCAPPSGAPTCLVCAWNNCCAELQVCLTETICTCVYNCLSNGNNKITCGMQCGAANDTLTLSTFGCYQSACPSCP